jgi:hypothetical protein
MKNLEMLADSLPESKSHVTRRNVPVRASASLNVNLEKVDLEIVKVESLKVESAKVVLDVNQSLSRLTPSN